VKFAPITVTTAATLALITLAMVGCSNKNSAAAEPTPAVTDISPTPPVAQQPPVIVQPAPAAEPAMREPAAAKGAITGRKYTVQKGDTLYNIAVRKYGKGTPANISKIENANPGVTAATLKAGQTITLP
jgi:nucleoid-associated protein YgaU